MKFHVEMVKDAEQDLFEIYQYIASTDSPAKAKKLIDQIESVCEKLETMPHRGRIPPELHRVGVDSYRKLIIKGYRIIYHVQGKDIFIHCVLDSRRELQEVLEQRLLR